jgi:hypothetical protein
VAQRGGPLPRRVGAAASIRVRRRGTCVSGDNGQPHGSSRRRHSVISTTPKVPVFFRPVKCRRPRWSSAASCRQSGESALGRAQVGHFEASNNRGYLRRPSIFDHLPRSHLQIQPRLQVRPRLQIRPRFQRRSWHRIRFRRSRRRLARGRRRILRPSVPALLDCPRRLNALDVTTRATQTLGVPLGQAPRAMTLMLATKGVALGGIVSRCAPIAHYRQFGCSEQLKLSHDSIFSTPDSPHQHSIMPIKFSAVAETSIFLSAIGKASPDLSQVSRVGFV